MNMKDKGLIGIIVLAIMLSGCSTANNESNGSSAGIPTTDVSKEIEESTDIQPSQDEILIVIDQTEKPIEGERGSFDFVVKNALKAMLFL